MQINWKREGGRERESSHSIRDSNQTFTISFKELISFSKLTCNHISQFQNALRACFYNALQYLPSISARRPFKTSSINMPKSDSRPSGERTFLPPTIRMPRPCLQPSITTVSAVLLRDLGESARNNYKDICMLHTANESPALLFLKSRSSLSASCCTQTALSKDVSPFISVIFASGLL